MDNGLPKPPDGGWGWMVVLASFCIHIVTDGMSYSFGIFYNEFLSYFREGAGYTAWIVSIMAGVTFCSGPLSSSLVNRYGCRLVTIAGAILASTCLALSKYAQNVTTLFFTIGLGAGLGLGLILLPTVVSVAMYFERLRSLAIGISLCGSGVGTFLLPPLMDVLIKSLGWRDAILVIAAIVLSCCVISGAMYRPLVAKVSVKEVEAVPLQIKETSDTSLKKKNFSMLKDPIFIIYAVSNFLINVGYSVPYVYLPSLAEVLKIGKERASYLLSLLGIANTLGRIVIGYLSDKPWINRLLVYNLSLTICGLATAFSALCLDFYSLAVYAVIFGFTIGGYVGLTSVILVDLLGLERLTNAFGLLLLFQGIASFIGPPLAGFLFDITKSYNPGFILAGSTITVGGAMLFCIPSIQRYLLRKSQK